MSRLVVEGVAVDLGEARVLHDVGLEVTEGSFAVIVGPSGCGKSTLLRAIAGLVHPAAGRVELAGTVMSDGTAFVDAARRGVGWVPQAASLFPHLTIAQNVAFGRGGRRGRTGRAGADEAIRELIDMTGLTGLAHRYPDQLSGGQAQRVALARALAARPGLLLLDEPFAALDPQLRQELREELREMLRRLGVTGVLVTHDQAEALLVADTVIVMREGTVVQQGTPVEVYSHPVSAWVASFLGEANFLAAAAEAGHAVTAIGEIGVADGASGDAMLMLRPEQLELAADGVRARVTRVRYGGHDALVDLETDDGLQLVARVQAGRIPVAGESTGVRVRGRAVAYPSDDRV